MPIPIAPVITAGATLLGQGIGAASNASINKKTRKWNEKMHKLQREESLADYAMQNQYNHPSSQMERLRAAGLNPNLVYGNGATTESASVKPADVKSWDPQPTRFDLGSVAQAGISTYYDTQIKQATVDNLRQQNTVLEKESLLKSAQTLSTLVSTDKTKLDISQAEFDLALKNTLRDINIQQRGADLDKTRADTTVALDENERRAAMQSSSLTIAAETILTMRLNRAKTEDERNEIKARIENIKKDTEIKELDRKMKEMGIQPSDPMWMRVLHRLFTRTGSSPAIDIIAEGIGIPKKKK